MDKKKEYSKKWATLIKAVSFLPADLPSITAYLDTGYGKDETIRILRRMWKGKLKWSFDDTYFGVYLFRWEEVDADEKYVDGICDGDVKFSSNWNGNKLGCTCWTTIRRWDEKKYKVGGIYRIYWPEEVRKMKKEENKKEVK